LRGQNRPADLQSQPSKPHQSNLSHKQWRRAQSTFSLTRFKTTPTRTYRGFQQSQIHSKQNESMSSVPE
jgi:hypothetical protein